MFLCIYVHKKERKEKKNMKNRRRAASRWTKYTKCQNAAILYDILSYHFIKSDFYVNIEMNK
jgi:hypothetical protein